MFMDRMRGFPGKLEAASRLFGLRREDRFVALVLLQLLLFMAYTISVCDGFEDPPSCAGECPSKQLNKTKKKEKICNEWAYTEYKGFPEWGYECYNGPKLWHKYYQICGCKGQSPICLIKNSSKVACDPKLKFLNYDIPPINLTLTNNGRTVMLQASYADKRPKVRLGNITYVFHNMHFHWALGKKNGTEHALEGKRYALEMHTVHTRDNCTKSCSTTPPPPPCSDCYECFTMAPIPPPPLLVVSTLFKESIPEGDTPYRLANLSLYLEYIKRGGRMVEMDCGMGTTLATLMPVFNSDFYKYMGSLTTPPCSRNVINIVNSETSPISPCELKAFRKLIDFGRTPLAGNVRPLQRSKGRKVYYMI